MPPTIQPGLSRRRFSRGSPRCDRCAPLALLTLLLAHLVAPAPAPNTALAHDPLLDLPPPNSVPEAWNVINASIANIATCLDTNQLREVAFHVANCSPALRTLQAHLPADAAARRDQLEAMYAVGAAVIEATRGKADPLASGRAQYEIFRARWGEIAAHYAPAERSADVFICPMHPLERHLDRAARCGECSMRLIRRRIPPSVVYEKPGAPSMKLTATPDLPLTPGKPATVTVRLARGADDSAVALEDLLVMHEQRIHLLIVDPTLLDYHHEHPTPTATPGTFSFTFTPRRPGPYRIWADIVPDETGIQEFVIADLPSAQPPAALADRAERLVDTVAGLRFELRFEPDDLPLLTGKVARARITLADAAGRPFEKLEPIMGAFAHLVGFADDYRTIIHLHPGGPEPRRPTDRGGPTLDFKFYPPRPGFYRFYAQVHVAGADHFARFGLTVAPAPAQR